MLASKPLSSNAIQVDLEGNERNGEAMLREMPKLLQPKLVAKITSVVSDVVQTRSVLQFLGDRPDHEPVDEARHRVAEIERNLSKRLEEIAIGRITRPWTKPVPALQRSSAILLGDWKKFLWRAPGRLRSGGIVVIAGKLINFCGEIAMINF